LTMNAKKKSPWMKRIAWLLLVVLCGLGIRKAFESVPVLVDVATVETGPLVITVDDDGRTRLRERYTVCAPVAGRLQRVPWKAGAPVEFDQTVLFRIEPLTAQPLDERQREEAEAQVQRAQSAIAVAQAEVQGAEAQLDYARLDLQRRQALEAGGFEAQKDFDLAQREERMAVAGLEAAQNRVRVAQLDLRIAQAALLATDGSTQPGTAIEVRAPMSGQVTRIFEESARTISAGTPILELGDTTRLEIVAEYLSQDAVKVEPGMAVNIRGWGGESLDGTESTLQGTVRHVEPSAFTKISALGVEEQRIHILIDPAKDPADWKALGDGYRTELEIIIWSRQNVRTVPTGALFRAGDDWAVFVIQNETAVERRIKLGHRNGLQAEVLEGLSDGDRVILYPSELVQDGLRVQVRGEAP
ncbi:MAG: HlyD family efflux transporter periplasmic adaptor subunit, partial [Planctomycetes bacterium]|nr:HlyD family efflux transporter periplasmic adaptor subunit [Planctomycetota bacterium]